jgi:hypothetical protein
MTLSMRWRNSSSFSERGFVFCVNGGKLAFGRVCDAERGMKWGQRSASLETATAVEGVVRVESRTRRQFFHLLLNPLVYVCVYAVTPRG